MALKQVTRDGIKWFNRTIIPNQIGVTEDKGDYSLLREPSDSPQSEPDVANCPRKRSNIYHYLFLLLKGIVFCFAIWGLYNLGGETVSKFRKPVSCSCGGTTVAEAKARGCVFTPLALGWLPPQCLDLELSDEFDKQGPLPGGKWPYWADRNGTIPLSREEMGYLGENNGVFYTTQEWHIKHCMYTWRKHYRSKFTGITVEQRSNGLDHIHHCEGIMLFQAPLDGIWTKAGVELNADRG